MSDAGQRSPLPEVEMTVSRRRIDEIVVGPRFRRDPGDLDQLAGSIRELGLLQPIVVTKDGTLVAGARRLEACRRLGWTDIPVHVVDLDEIVRGEYAENAVRKDFTPSELVAIARALAAPARAAAKARQQHHAGTAPGRPATAPGNTPGNLPEVLPAPAPKGRAMDQVARYAGVSRRTLEKAIAVVEAAEREPAAFAPLVAEMDRTGRVNGVYRKLQVALSARALAAAPPPLPTGPFEVIVADPPWCYEKRATDPSHRLLPYPTMPIEAIKALPVGDLAADSCILWLWTTNAHLPVAFEVVQSWGFEYKTLLTWVKDRMGIGDWLRGQTEHCLLAVRGRPVVRLTNQTTALAAPVREHSRKPEAFYALVESLCPGRKLELFARAQRPGWVAWGNETTQFDPTPTIAADTETGTGDGEDAA